MSYSDLNKTTAVELAKFHTNLDYKLIKGLVSFEQLTWFLGLSYEEREAFLGKIQSTVVKATEKKFLDIIFESKPITIPSMEYLKNYVQENWGVQDFVTRDRELNYGAGKALTESIPSMPFEPGMKKRVKLLRLKGPFPYHPSWLEWFCEYIKNEPGGMLTGIYGLAVFAMELSSSLPRGMRTLTLLGLDSEDKLPKFVYEKNKPEISVIPSLNLTSSKEPEGKWRHYEKRSLDYYSRNCIVLFCD